MGARSTEEMIASLNGLIETCREAERCFRAAAESVASSGLRELFSTYARQRRQFAEELAAEVRRLGGEPETSGGIDPAIHRGWVDVKSDLGRNEEGAVIAEVERGEDAAVRSYRDALGKPWDPELRRQIERQYTRIHEVHDRIRSLEKATAL